VKKVLVILVLILSICTLLQAQNPEPTGWYAGDMHVHRSCGGSPQPVSTIYQKLSGQNLAALSLLADMGNGEVKEPGTDLPLVNGQDDPVSTPGRIVHWDAEWHWDPTYTQYPHLALGGHIVALGLREAHQIWDESTFPIFSWAHQQNGIAGFAHMQYLDDGFPQTLSCCTPIEYPVEVALASADFVSEDVDGNEYPIQAYYRLLNSGFRPGFAAGTDYPCNDGSTVGSPLTYVRVAGGDMTYRNWIDGISNGRTVISRNGHNEFLDLKVNSTAAPGDEIHLTGSGTAQVTVQWTAIQNLSGTIELVANGVVVASKQTSVSSGSGSSLSASVDFTKSGWLAARRMGSNGHVVHTGAVYVTVDNAPVRANAADPQFYVQWMDNLLTNTSPGGPWNKYFPTSLSAAQARYQAAKALYQQIAQEAQGTSPTLNSITVTPGNPSIGIGSTQQFTATGYYSNGSSLNITGQVVWASSNTSIANVNLRGLAVAANAGTAQISATLRGINGSTSVTVQGSLLVITTQSLPAGKANTAYTATLAASGGTPPYAWSVISGALPTGTTLNSSTGVISGTPTTAATFNFTVQVVDSGNPAQITTKALSIVIASAGSCPCTIWPSTTVPVIADSGADSSVEIGVRFRADSNGSITAIRFYKGAGNTDTHVGNLWAVDGTRLATATFTNETASGWQQVNLSSPVAITANTVYVASYHANSGHYADDMYGFTSGVDNPPLHALADGVSGANGVYAYGSSSAFPNQGWNSSNYWVDVVFTPPDNDLTPPTVTTVTPPSGAASVATNTTVTATFSEAMDASTVNSSTFVLRDAQDATVAATVNYNSSNNTAVLTPTSPLQYSAAYTALLKGGSTDPRVKDSAGNALAANFTWSFTTVGPDTTPPTISNVAASSITATGATITWSTNEASDSQVLYGATSAYGSSSPLNPAAVTSHSVTLTGLTAGTTYHYAVKSADAANNSATSTDFTLTTLAQDTTPPVISNITVTNITTTGATVSWTTDEASNSQVVYGTTASYGSASALNSSLVTAHTVTVTGLSANTIYHFAVKSQDASSNLATSSDGTFTTATSGGGGSSYSLWPATTVPGTIDEGPDSAVNLGVRFRSDTAATVTGIRFYKASTNTGTHIGYLFTASGTLLASVTFSNETVSGWQEATFSSPVNITANTDYLAAYSCPNGHYSGNPSYFSASRDVAPLHAPAGSDSAPNGVFAYGSAGRFPDEGYNNTNYWVDIVVLAGSDTTPPSVVSVTPANGSSLVSVAASVTATFSESIEANTLTASTFQLVDASNNVVPATITWDAANNLARLQPSAILSYSTTYTATLRGGSNDPRVKDPAGNALAANYSWSFTTANPPPPPPPGTATPILLVTSPTNTFSNYYAEILRNEGFSEFSVADIGLLSSTLLSNYDLVILPQTALTAGQVSTLQNWVGGGGNLIAMRPDKQLAGMLGLADAGTTLSDAYLTVSTASGPGVGITGQSIQFHGAADRYTLNGATKVATLYSDATTALSNPAVSLTNYGSGQAAFFAYDLARSVVSTRQGNPAWSGQERDDYAPIRSDDLFFGGSVVDYVDLDKVAIPQADEQQRLLANLMLTLNLTRRPLPRFWYLPRGLKAAVVMTGDDHGNGGTTGRWDGYIAASPANCSVDNWECVRGTSYVYPETPITPTEAQQYSSQGFELALHLLTGCADFTPASLEGNLSSQLAEFAAAWPTVPAPSTNRTHCIVWSDYDTEPQLEFNHGIRLDANYYYWPGNWINDRPGFMTGSGMPMRFATRNGALLDIYQAATQMTDESSQSYPFTINTLLDNAIGPLGYYGVFTANLHTDNVASEESDAVVASAKARGVPVVSAKQMLTWLDGRNGSTISAVSWDGTTLGFQLQVAPGATGLRVMLPVNVGVATLNRVLLNGSSSSFSTQLIKGIQYAFVNGATGTYQAVYTGSPTVLSSFTVSPTQVIGGSSATGTVNLNNPAPSGGAVVTLTSDNVAVGVPASVTIAAGATSKTFNITTSSVGSAVTANLSASYGGVTRPASLTVNPAPPPAITSVSVSPTSVTGGTSSTGTVTLAAAAGTGGATVSLSDNSSAATVPASVTVAAGSTSANFTITTSAVGASTAVTITASNSQGSKTATLTVVPPVISAFSFNPTTVVGGSNSTGTVTLNGPAPTGGAAVTLSDNSSAAAEPASVTVAAGATSATFTATTSAVSASTAVTVTATYLSSSRTASLTVTPPTLSAFSFSPATVVGGTNSTGTVTLNGPAPTGGASVTLSDNSSAATEPASVTVAAGATSATFTATTSVVTTSTAVTVTATYLSSSRTAGLTVNPSAQLAIDKTVSKDRGTSGSSITSPSFSTASANELLLAFIATDASASNMTVTSVTGAGLTWSLVRRTNAQLGTAEIWRAFAPATVTNVSVVAKLARSVPASITVVTFTGVDTSGSGGSGAIGATGTGNANPGAPTASLTTTRNKSWVFGVGIDWDHATARTLGLNQTMVHQYLATGGDTYWVQRSTSTTPLAGTVVTINDTAPTADRYNLSIVEILPAL
jgi:hypothetical protein